MADNITQFESVGGFSGANLFVSGATFTGNVAMTSTSSHTGLASFAGGITASGATFTGNVAMTSTSSHTGLASFAGGITASGITVNGPIVASGLGTFTAGITSSSLITGMNGIWMPAGQLQLGGTSYLGGGSLYYTPAGERLYVFGFADINNTYDYQAARSPLRLNVGPNHTSNILGAYVQTAQGTILSSTTDSTNLKSGIDNKGVIFSYVGLTASGATFTGNVAMTSTSSHTGLASFAGGISASGGVTFASNIYAPNIVTGVNGVTGGVTLSAGTNISVTTVGKTITIGVNPSSYLVQARLASNAGITNGADYTIPFTAEYDTPGWWNATTRRFTPTIAGHYQFTMGAWWNSTGGITNGQMNIQARKNNTTFAIVQDVLNSFTGKSQGWSKIKYMNGSTDWVDFTVYTDASPSHTLLAGANTEGTWFSAHLI